MQNRKQWARERFCVYNFPCHAFELQHNAIAKSQFEWKILCTINHLSKMCKLFLSQQITY